MSDYREDDQAAHVADELRRSSERIDVARDDDTHLLLRWQGREVAAFISRDGRLWVTLMAPGGDDVVISKHTARDNVMVNATIICDPMAKKEARG